MIRTPCDNDTTCMFFTSVFVFGMFDCSSVEQLGFIFYVSAKKGACTVPSDDISTCVEPSHECSIDHDCDGDMKCCQQACGRVCVEPDIEGMPTYLRNLTYKL